MLYFYLQEIDSVKLDIDELKKEIVNYDEQLKNVEASIVAYGQQVEEINEKLAETKVIFVTCIFNENICS